jgi:transcriptional regulator with XRE-family HTH domain
MPPLRSEQDIRDLIQGLPRNPETACWGWDRASRRNGYGQIGWLGKKFCIHRLAYQFFVGEVGDACVLHRCDNRNCCNPEHLFLGSRADNIRDMLLKERGPKAKLTIAQAREIRWRQGEDQTALGREFGVSQVAISRIQRGEGWKHIGELDRCRDHRAKLIPDQVRKIRALLATHTDRQLGDLFGVTPPTIRAIRQGRTWRYV